MTKHELLAFLRRHQWAVESSVHPSGGPQAAVVGFAVTDSLEFVFDTLDAARKVRNLRRDARVALVIGWDEGQTVQVEGEADEPRGDTLSRLKLDYFQVFPDGRARESWPGIAFVRVRPTWIRYADFRSGKPVVSEGSPTQFRD